MSTTVGQPFAGNRHPSVETAQHGAQGDIHNSLLDVVGHIAAPDGSSRSAYSDAPEFLIPTGAVTASQKESPTVPWLGTVTLPPISEGEEEHQDEEE